MNDDVNLHNIDANERGYALAYRIAVEKIADADLIKQCEKSGADYSIVGSHPIITVNLLNRKYHITFPEIEISTDDGIEAKIKEKLLLLHYFLRATGSPISGNMISFKELPQGAFYFASYYARTLKPLKENFGKEPQRLVAAACTMQGVKSGQGDVSVTINAFPMVPITIVLWRGDNEFPPDANILFEPNISDYLETEDIVVLTETLVWNLIKINRAS